jgi:hypothetical protein
LLCIDNARVNVESLDFSGLEDKLRNCIREDVMELTHDIKMAVNEDFTVSAGLAGVEPPRPARMDVIISQLDVQEERMRLMQLEMKELRASLTHQLHQLEVVLAPSTALVNSGDNLVPIAARTMSSPHTKSTLQHKMQTSSRSGQAPWWVKCCVSPEGPIKVKGCLEQTTFSVLQQERFGIDEHGNIMDPARFETAVEMCDIANNSVTH